MARPDLTNVYFIPLTRGDALFTALTFAAQAHLFVWTSVTQLLNK